jgi:ubiquinone/menaquinone biosynthesis C-methylase UbiE
MLEPWKAQHILEVGCGTGKLLPIAANLKGPNAHYLATDLSPQMIKLTMTNLTKNLSLYDSKLTL